MIDRKPRLIIRAAGTPDVIAAVALARETGLPFAIKGGGHGVNGHAACDDGIMLDLSPMKKITVDATARTVIAEAGSTGVSSTPPPKSTGLRRPAAV
jgi:FAD/FMN-containing dehydrogenase